MTTPTFINTIVPQSERMSVVDGLFGMAYMLKLEPAVFSIAEALAESYTGGYWEFHDLSNGGFYMAPNHDTEFAVSCENGFEGKLSLSACTPSVSCPLEVIVWHRPVPSNTTCCGNSRLSIWRPVPSIEPSTDTGCGSGVLET